MIITKDYVLKGKLAVLLIMASPKHRVSKLSYFT